MVKPSTDGMLDVNIPFVIADVFGRANLNRPCKPYNLSEFGPGRSSFQLH